LASRGWFETLALGILSAASLVASTEAQTYKISSGSSPAAAAGNATPESAQKSLGWGSNIENARLARAAADALRAGQYSKAANYARRAAEGAPKDAGLWFLLGYAARLSGKLQLSIAAYEHGLAEKPNALEGLSGLAQTYSEMGRREEAERILTQVLEADPSRTGDAELLGEVLVQSGQYQRALGILSRTEQARPAARSELLMALSYQHLKQLDEANHYLNLAKRRAPNNPDVLRSLASFYRASGNYEAAIAALDAIPRKRPDLTAELGYTYQLAGRKDISAKLYAQAADAAPRNLALQLSAAQAQVGMGAIEPAEAFLRRAAALDPEHYRLHAIRGEIARLEDRNREALQEYNFALEHLPQSPAEGPLYGIQLHMNLMELNKSLEDETAAEDQLRMAQAEINSLDDHGPTRGEFLRLRALIRMNAGDLDGAGQDVKEALAINGKDLDTLQLDGDLLVRIDRPEQAIAAYRKILAAAPDNRSALTSLGYVCRAAGHDQEAEKYFQKLAAAYPRLYVPYLALGDMYTSRREFAKAEAVYRKAIELAPANPLIIAGGMNAAIEAHHFPVAAEWLKRAPAEAQQHPQVLRERERYLNWIGQYEQSEQVGRMAIKKLPTDRDVVVYLGYDLLRLQRYDELFRLATQYDTVLGKEPDIPLFEGYVHKHDGKFEEAEQDFTRVLDRDSSAVTAYVNRGYVRNDLHKPADAAADFEAALRLEPKNGEAHLGLAYASLDLHRPKVALAQAQMAEQALGDSLALDLIRATAYGETGIPTRAAEEYRAALKYSPRDPDLHLALGDILYGLDQYTDALSELETADRLSANNSAVEARLARSYAQLQDRTQTLRYVQLAEQHAEPKKQSAVLLSTGEALNLLGDRDAALERFDRALTAPNSDRIGVRLAVAKLMVGEDQPDAARRQVALGFMEARTGEALPPTGDQFLEAADIFLATHDLQLSQKYFQSALAAGAAETAVRIGLANTYLAEGDTTRAQAQIASISNPAKSEPSYQYLLAKANVFRQEHQNVQALTAFAQAASAAGQDDTAERELLETAGDEGLRLNRRVSFLSNFSVAPIFEDTTVYPLDAKLDVPNPVAGRQGLLPLPRSSLETQWTGAYHLHFNGLPDAGGFFQVRNARGEISLPSANAIIHRDTTDYSFNFGVNPTLHFSNNVLTFSTGIQETIRRDATDPRDMDQNLFRQFVYLSTSAFYNLVSVNGYAIHETGPFTLTRMNSRDWSGALEFRVGRPWGKTALVTGWGARDDQFSPIIREFYFTSSYLGIERQVSQRLRFRAVAEDLRSWRVESNNFAIAQALRPAGSLEYAPTRHWSLEASAAYSRNMGFHAYDALHSGFSISYAKSVGRIFREDTGDDVNLRYPIRFSIGLQQEDFFHFTGGNSQQFKPYVSISLF
jgi:tetratricopeptide (TPR) repeat protein